VFLMRKRSMPNAVRNLWEAMYSARPITGIDMNINYPGGGINNLPGPIRDHWYNSDAEAWLLARRITAGTTMIDYQFVDRPQMQAMTTEACVPEPSLSDHRFCIGYFRVN
jgi:hypothetical protein